MLLPMLSIVTVLSCSAHVTVMSGSYDWNDEVGEVGWLGALVTSDSAPVPCFAYWLEAWS
jgi:hypothetical protein